MKKPNLKFYSFRYKNTLRRGDNPEREYEPFDIQLMFFKLVLWVLYGGLVGWAGSLLLGHGVGQGLVGNIAIGTLGASLGGYIIDMIFYRIGLRPRTGAALPVSGWSFLTAVLGAITFVVLSYVAF